MKYYEVRTESMVHNADTDEDAKKVYDSLVKMGYEVVVMLVEVNAMDMTHLFEGRFKHGSN